MHLFFSYTRMVFRKVSETLEKIVVAVGKEQFPLPG